MPVYGTLRKQTLFGFFGDAESIKTVSVIPIAKPEKRDFLGIASNQCKAHCRHHSLGDVLWYKYGPERVYRDRSDGGHAQPMPALLKEYERERVSPFQPGYDPAPGVAIDLVPLSDNSLRVFFFVMRTKKIETWETEWALLTKKDKKGRIFEVFPRDEPIADERNPETIDSAFAEDFYVFKRKTDYYFVTQSGEMYIAPPPKKGEKSRTMAALWDDKTRPIVGIVEDADNDKVWLFAQNKKDAKLGYYFEMKPRTSFETFDPTKLKPVNAGGRAKRLLEYLPLIRAQEKKDR